MPIREPEQTTSNLPSCLKDFRLVAQLMQPWISSKKISVSPGTNVRWGFIKEIFFKIVPTSNPLSKMDLYCFCKIKFISITFLYCSLPNRRMDSVLPICLAPFTISGKWLGLLFHCSNTLSIFLFNNSMALPSFRM